MLTFAYVPGASQFPFGGDVSVILPMRSSAGTPGGAQNWAGSRLLKPVHCSIAPGSLTGTFRPIVPNAAESTRPRSRNFRRFGLTPCAGTRRPANASVTTFYTYPERRRL